MDEIIKSIPSSIRYFFGLIFILCLLALICSVIVEVLSSTFRLRSKTLELTVRSLLGTDVATQFYNHPFIAGLARAVPKDAGKPSYIPSRVFSLVLLDVISPRYMSATSAAEALRVSVDRMPDSGLKSLLVLFLGDAQGDIERLHRSISYWFQYSMDRMSPIYRRRVQALLIPVALILAFALNADSIRITNTLAVSEAEASAISQAAQTRIKELKPSDTDQSRQIVKDVVSQLDDLSLLGWSSEQGNLRSVPRTATGWWMKLAGLLITAVAVAFLAQVLFELLNRFIGFRETEKKVTEVEISS